MSSDDVARAFGAYAQALEANQTAEAAKLAARQEVERAVDAALFRCDPTELCDSGVYASGVVARVLRQRLDEVERWTAAR